MTTDFLNDINKLRLAFPKDRLQYIEREILNRTSAKITKAKDYDNAFRVSAGNQSFLFAYNKTDYENFDIIRRT